MIWKNDRGILNWKSTNLVSRASIEQPAWVFVCPGLGEGCRDATEAEFWAIEPAGG